MTVGDAFSPVPTVGRAFLRKTTDSSGHAHDTDGRFTALGSGGAGTKSKTTFRSLREALRAGYHIVARTSEGYTVRTRTKHGWVAATVREAA